MYCLYNTGPSIWKESWGSLCKSTIQLFGVALGGNSICLFHFVSESPRVVLLIFCFNLFLPLATTAPAPLVPSASTPCTKSWRWNELALIEMPHNTYARATTV